MKPFGLMADLHLHSWSAFSSVNEDGTNSRLAMLLKEVVRGAEEVKKAGGDTLFIAGDIFHVRGSIAPSVLNPTLDTFEYITGPVCDGGLGVHVVAISGNHDLEGKKSTRLGSAITALEGKNVAIASGSGPYGSVYMVPWVENLNELKELLVMGQKKWGSEILILHAPVNGVIPGLPDHGLDPYYLADIGYKRVFAGHYHNHKDFGNGVYSIGALAHNSWSDVGSKAGFLIVDGDSVKWFKSHLPEFIDITGDMDQTEAEILAEGNYIRAKVTTTKTAEVESLRKMFLDAGAKGVVIQSVRAPTVARTGSVSASVKAGASLEVSVSEYVKGQSFSDLKRLEAECLSILGEAGE